MKRLDQGIAGLMILLGIRFALVAPREFAAATWPWATGFWLVNCAVLFVSCGALQLVRIRYGAVAPPLRAVAALMSVAIAALQGVAGVVGGEAAPASVVAALCVISAALSFRVPATSAA